MMNPLRELKLNQPGRIEPVGAPSRSGVDGTVREISKEAILLELRESADSTEFRVGQRVTFKYWDVLGLHRGETEVTRISGRRPAELEVAPPDRVELTQKRRFFRVNVSVPVSLRRANGQDGDPVVQTHTEDLTPAGMRVTSTVAFHVDDLLDVRIDFAASTGDSTAPVHATARVVRTGQVAGSQGELFTASVQFLALPDSEQMRVSLLLFELQRHVTA